MYKYNAFMSKIQPATTTISVVNDQQHFGNAENRTTNLATSLVASRQIYNAITAVLLNIALVAILIVVVVVPISLTSSGSLSSLAKTLYITGITVVATLTASFTKGQIRKVWLRKVGVQLSGGAVPEVVSASWRTALGLGSAGNREALGYLLYVPCCRTVYHSYRRRSVGISGH